MVRKKDQMRMKGLLSEAITVLCKASLSYRCEFSIEGLIGITIDNEEIFLVNINEIVQKPGMRNECEKDPPHKEERPSSPPRRRPSLHSTSSQRSASSSPSHRSEELRKARRKAQESGPLAKRIKTDRNSDPIVIKEEEEDSNDFSSATAMSPATPDSAAFTSPRHENTTIHDSSTDPISNIMDSVAGLKSNTGFQIQQVPGIDDSSGDKMADDYGSHLSLSADNSLPGCSTWDGSSHNVGDQGQGGNNSQEAPGPLPAKVKVEADADASSSSWPEGGSSSQEGSLHQGGFAKPMAVNQSVVMDTASFLPPMQKEAAHSGFHKPAADLFLSSGDTMEMPGNIHAQGNLHLHDDTGRSQAYMPSNMVTPLNVANMTSGNIPPNLMSIFYKDLDPNRYACQLCKKTFKYASGLKTHMVIHENKSFPCSLCDKVFRMSNSLRMHMMNKHGMRRRFLCHVCSRRFGSDEELTEHMANEHPR